MAAKLTFDDKLERLLEEADGDMDKLWRVHELSGFLFRMAEKRAKAQQSSGDGAAVVVKRKRPRSAILEQAIRGSGDDAK